jgi:hypothetical protein
MPIVKTFRGVENVAELVLLAADGVTPLVTTTPPLWEVVDYTGSFLIGGVGVQDVVDTETWRATFTIPSNAPISESYQKHRIDWTAQVVGGTQYKSREFFLVQNELDPLEIEMGSVGLTKGKVSNTLCTTAIPTQITFRLISDGGAEIIGAQTVSVTPTSQSGGKYYFQYTSPAAVSTFISLGGFQPYLAEWIYTLPALGEQFEVHPVYAISHRGMKMVQQIRQYIDRAANEDINPNLIFTDLDICNFLMMGLSRYNGTGGTLTGYNIDSLPQQSEYFVIKCAVVEALQAQYLAEGMSAFDFSGQSTQLTIDRTQYIDSMIQQIESSGGGLEEAIRKQKKTLNNQSCVGVLGMTYSPSHAYFGYPDYNPLVFLSGMIGRLYY